MSWFSKQARKSGIPGLDKTTSAQGTIFEDFAEMPWTDRTEDEYARFFRGDYSTRDYLNPGGVMANPAQQIADPGNYFTRQEHDKWVDEGKVSDRTLASALVAGTVYGASGAPGLLDAGASTTSVSGAGAAGGSAAGKSAPGTTLAMEDGGYSQDYSQDYSPVEPDYSSNVDPSYDNAANSGDYNWNVPDNYYDGTNAGLDDATANNINDMSGSSSPQTSYSTNTGTGTGTSTGGKTDYTPYAQALATGLGSWLQYKGSQEAADAVKEGSDKSADIQGYMFDKAWGSYEPYRTLGESALPYLEYMTTGKGAPLNIEDSPMYTWQKDKGTKALNQQLAARGLYNSGAGVQSLSDFYSRLGAEESQRQYARVLDAANIGRGAATGQSAAAMSTGQSLGNLYYNTGNNLGQNRQGLYEGVGNQVVSGIGSYLDYNQNKKLY